MRIRRAIDSQFLIQLLTFPHTGQFLTEEQYREQKNILRT